MKERFNSGESSFIFGINFHKFLAGRMIVGKHAWQQEEDQCNLVDPSFQDNVVTQRGFFPHVYHIGCAFNLHSTTGPKLQGHHAEDALAVPYFVLKFLVT